MTRNEKLGKRLKKAREIRLWTVLEAAEKAGIGDGEIIFVEGGRGAGPATLRGLARAYGLDFIDLMIEAGHLTRADVARHQVRRAA